MRYLGLDLGAHSLGVAVSDKNGILAHTLKTIRHNEDYDALVVEVSQIVSEYNVNKIVLGYPKNMNNSLGVRARLSEEFKKKLEEKIDIEVILQDERLTTVEAENMLIKGDVSRKKRKKVIDSVAANIILQSFLDRRNKNGRE